MVLDGLVADAEFATDDLVAVTACDEVQDLDLARRKLDEERPEGLRLGAAGEVRRLRGRRDVRRGRGRGILTKLRQDARGDGWKPHNFLVDRKLPRGSAPQRRDEEVGIGAGAHVRRRADARRLE